MTSNQDSMASININSSETNTIFIIGHKLNGNNYLPWSQSMMMFINDKGKDEYLSCEAVQKKKKKKEDPKFKT